MTFCVRLARLWPAPAQRIPFEDPAEAWAQEWDNFPGDTAGITERRKP